MIQSRRIQKTFKCLNVSKENVNSIIGWHSNSICNNGCVFQLSLETMTGTFKAAKGKSR